jgi:GAF domain-containing protein
MEEKIGSIYKGPQETRLALRYGISFLLLSIFISGITYQLSRNYLLVLLILPIIGILSWLVAKFIAYPINSIFSITQELLAGNSKTNFKIRTKIPEIIQIVENIKTLTEQAKLISNNSDIQLLLHEKEFEEVKIKHARQIDQYKAIGFVARAIVSLQDTETILQKITQLISEHFGYYHVGIFLLDKSKENAILRATNSDGGLKMMARGHSLLVGKVGIVGFVTEGGEARIASDTGTDAVFFDNPDLPKTRSELSLPLKIGDEIIGALDIQSTETSAFSHEDVSILNTLADQIALVMQNSELYDETRKSLKDIEVINRQYIKSAWEKLPQENDIYGYTLNQNVSSPLRQQIKPGQNSQRLRNDLSIPIQLRGVTIGSLNLRNNKDQIFSSDQVDVARAVADRVAISLENARLLDEASRVAQRERAVGDITTKIRSANEPQAMIQTALDELKRILQTDQIRISPIKNVPTIDDTSINESHNKSDPGYRTQ